MTSFRIGRSDRAPAWLLIAAGIALAIGLGAAAAFAPFNALILVALALLAPLVLWFFGSLERALLLLVLVIAVMPRFASPVSVGFKPTFLDAALIGVLLAWALRQLGAARERFPLTRNAISVPLLLLVVTAVATFIVGIPNGALTTLVARRFVELVLSLLSVLVFAALFAKLEMRERFVRYALLCGGLSALIGIALYAMPDALAIQILSALRPFDYPTGPSVLRFIRDDPALSQRATGLWIDPNAFGGYLLMTGALCLPQVFAKQPVLSRPLVLGCVAAIGLCLVLTVSRGAMLGLSLAALLIGVLHYRRMLPLGALVLVAILVLPQTRALVLHFIDGFLGNDLATQMRFGEYKDAFRLIERYPLLGVGFTGSPDVDLYVGVSSMYLLIMQQMGVLGISAFALTMLALLAGAVRSWPQVRANDRAAAIFLGGHGAVVGVLFSGIFDHYFFNIDFHNAVAWLCLMWAVAVASQKEQ
jgi:polysaccharide biosynthesis protein PslJ